MVTEQEIADLNVGKAKEQRIVRLAKQCEKLGIKFKLIDLSMMTREDIVEAIEKLTSMNKKDVNEKELFHIVEYRVPWARN